MRALPAAAAALAVSVWLLPASPAGQTPEAVIGTLCLARSLDRAYANALEQLSRTQIAILSEGLLLATTLDAARARAFETVAW